MDRRGIRSQVWIDRLSTEINLLRARFGIFSRISIIFHLSETLCCLGVRIVFFRYEVVQDGSNPRPTKRGLAAAELAFPGVSPICGARPDT